MKEIVPATLTQQENYKLLIGSIIPRPVALVTHRVGDWLDGPYRRGVRQVRQDGSGVA